MHIHISEKRSAQIILVLMLFLVAFSGMPLTMGGKTLSASDASVKENNILSIPSLDANDISMAEASTQFVPPDEEIPVTRWDSEDDPNLTPFKPETYGPLKIEKVESTSHNSDFVYVIVHGTLWSDIDIRSRILRYETDVEATGYSVTIAVYGAGSPEFLRAWIDSQRDALITGGDDLVGCLLVGDIPTAWYEMDTQWDDPPAPPDHEEFPIDLFYMDLDGTWTDAEPDGLYDAHTGDVAPEIWIGRVKADDMFDPEDDLIENYFDKNHDYRTGSLSLPQRALVYVDDDWAPGGSFSTAVGHAYSTRTLVDGPAATTNAANYIGHIANQYSFVHLMCHGGPARHSFEIPNPTPPPPQISGGRVYGYHATDDNYRNLDPPVFFYNLFVCSGARFTETDYLAGWCIFTDTWGLAAVGSTKTGSMYPDSFGTFYTPLGNGDVMGEAFRHWFDTHGEDTYFGIWRAWHYGMTIIGDPTLRVSGKHLMTINTPGLAGATGVVHYTEDGVAKTGDISGGSWSDHCDHGTTLSIDSVETISSDERYATADTHSWSVAEPRTFTVNYYHQFLMEVSSTGGLLTSSYKGTTNYMKFATSQTGHYWDASPWSDWCDIGSTLTASQIVPGPPNERYHTPGTVQWTVTDSESYELPYHKEYKVTIKAEGLPDTLSTTVTVGTADPSPSDDVAGGDINNYVLTLDSSSIPPFTWTNWVHADTDMTALSLITVSASEKYILVYWTRDGLRFGPPTVYAEVAGLTYSAQYAGVKKEMSLDEAELCNSVTVTIEISNPPAGTASDTVYVIDDLPNELSFVKNSAEVDGTAYTPDLTHQALPELHERLAFEVDGSGTHTITFEVKVNRAYAAHTVVENHVGVTFDLIDVGEVPVDVSFEVAIHPYIGPTLSKAADGPEIVPLFTKESWVFTYIVKNNYDYEMASPSLKDNFGAELVYDQDTVIANLLTEWEFPTKNGRSEKISLFWDLPNLAPGEAYKLQVTMSTGKTPSKHAQQEYTSPGVKILNSGATLKWFDDTDKKQSLETGTISVTAVGQISGYVRDQYGEGVPGVKLELYFNGELIQVAETDSSGQYSFMEALTQSGVYTVKIVTLPTGYNLGSHPSEKTATYNVGQIDPTAVYFEVAKI